MIFAELEIFQQVILDLLSQEEFRKLQNELLKRPKAGEVIQKTNGARKYRFGKKGRGKRGGLRVIYFFNEEKEKIWFLAVYEKTKKIDLSSDDKKYLRYIIDTLKMETKKQGGRI